MKRTITLISTAILCCLLSSCMIQPSDGYVPVSTTTYSTDAGYYYPPAPATYYGSSTTIVVDHGCYYCGYHHHDHLYGAGVLS